MDIEQLIRQRAQERGVDPDTALSIAQAESSMRPGAKNPRSSARGLFQVTDGTWKQYGGDPKKRGDINEDIRVGLDIIADNTAALSQTLGRAPRPAEVYAAHFFGKAGARRILSADPNTPVDQVVSKAVMRANPEILKGRTVAEAINVLGRKVGDETSIATSPESVGRGAGRARSVPAVGRPVGRGYREDPANPPVISRAVEQTEAFGPGYQAALALSYLADTEESSDDENAPSIVEREAAAERQAQAAPQRSSAAQQLASMDFGFAPVVGQQQQPVRMAEGGMIGRLSNAIRNPSSQSEDSAPNFTTEEIAQIRRGLAAQGFKEPQRTGGALGRMRTVFSRLRGAAGSTHLTQAELQALYGMTGLTPQEAPASSSPARTQTASLSRTPFSSVTTRALQRAAGAQPAQQVPSYALTQELLDAKRAAMRGTPDALGFGELMPDAWDAYKARFPTLSTFTPAGAQPAAPVPGSAASMLQQVEVPTPGIMGTPLPLYMAEGGEVGAPPPNLTPNQRIVWDAYRSVLGRDPEPQGFANWTRRLNSGNLNPSNFMPAFQQSAFRELAPQTVGQYYQNVLGRTPGEQEAAYWTNEIQAGRLTPDTFSQAFRTGARPELEHQANKRMVPQLFQQYLGRDPSEQELADWTGRLDAGLPRLAASTYFQQDARPELEARGVTTARPAEVATPSVFQRIPDSSTQQPQPLQQPVPQPQFATAQTWQQALDTPNAMTQQPQFLADGGEVSDPYEQMMRGAPRTRVSPAQFVKGGWDTAAGMLKGATQAAVGMPGDIESLIRMGVGSEREAVLPTTDRVKAFIDRYAPLGLPADEGTGGRTAAEYFGEFMSPAAATRPLVRGAQAVGEGVMEGARRAERALDQPVQDIMRRGGTAAELLESFSTVPAHAVRPPGGNVFPELVNDVVASNDVRRAIERLPANRQDDIQEFLNTKAKRYFEKDYASTKDPLYEAFKEGRISTLSDTPAFRGYMLNAARDGNPQALEDLARNYDRGLEPTLISRPRAEGSSFTSQLEGERAAFDRLMQSLQEAPGSALDVERQLPSRYSIFRSQENIEGYPLNRPLSEGEMMAVERGDPIYRHSGSYAVPDFMRPESIVEALADIPAERLKSMSYPEAVIAINQPARFRANWDSAVARVREGKDVPKDVKNFGLSDPLLKSDNGAWHRIQDARAAEMEGAMMGHSVGGYSRVGSYGHGGLEALQSGRAQVYTLRDSKGNARVTVEALNTPEGMEITQIKGRSNAGPREAEVQDVMKLFEQLDEGGRLRGIRTESYLTKENAPADALQGTTEWQRLYDEYLLGKQ